MTYIHMTFQCRICIGGEGPVGDFLETDVHNLS